MSAGPSPPSGSASSQGHWLRWTAALAWPLVDLLAACRAGIGLLFGLPFIVPVGATGVAVMFFGAGVLVGVQSAITPLILSRQPSSDTGTVQSLNWLALTAGIALGASFGGALLAAGDLPFVGLGTLGLSWLAAMILFWPRSSGSRPPQRGTAKP